jgi:small multidrug resistance family-3 protein
MRPNAAMWGWFALAAVGELAGCYAVWAWARAGRPAWWLLWGLASLIVFAWALTRIESSFAGRTFAAYGGVYVAAALAWLVMVEGARPDRWDLLGVGICLIGTLVIVLAPR